MEESRFLSHIKLMFKINSQTSLNSFLFKGRQKLLPMDNNSQSQIICQHFSILQVSEKQNGSWPYLSISCMYQSELKKRKLRKKCFSQVNQMDLLLNCFNLFVFPPILDNFNSCSKKHTNIKEKATKMCPSSNQFVKHDSTFIITQHTKMFRSCICFSRHFCQVI